MATVPPFCSSIDVGTAVGPLRYVPSNVGEELSTIGMRRDGAILSSFVVVGKRDGRDGALVGGTKLGTNVGKSDKSRDGAIDGPSVGLSEAITDGEKLGR